MTYQIFQPSDQLKPFVHFYWIMEMDNDRISISSSQRIIPNGFVEIMFHYGDKLTIIRNNETENQPQTVISGQKTGYFDIRQTGKTGFIAVLFKPHTVRLFFDLPVCELTNLSVSLDTFSGNATRFITEQIAGAPSHECRIEIVESFLTGLLKDKNFYNVNRLSASMEIINRNRGIVKVSDLASAACLSEKQFYRIFSEFVGITPKQFLKIVRLQHAFYQMQTGLSQNLTQLAYNCGYYDQAHFINDFKAQTGILPKNCFHNPDSFSDYFG